MYECMSEAWLICVGRLVVSARASVVEAMQQGKRVKERMLQAKEIV